MNADLSCHECRDALVQLAAGTLPAAERQAVERHLASCADCRRERDNWLALGDAIRESERRLPADSGFATGLTRLRTALTLTYDDDFEHLEGENPSMEHDSRSNDTFAPAAPHDERATTSGGSRVRAYPAIAATVAIVLLMALVFGALATRLRPGPGFGTGGSPTRTPVQVTTPTPTLMPAWTPGVVQAVPDGVSAVSISMVSASEGWAVATLPNNIGATLMRYANGHWSLSGDSFAGIYLTDISMDSHDDGWAVGAHTDQVTGVVLHYSGGHWSQVQTPQIQFAGARVWAFSPSRVLVLAALPKDQTGTGGSALERYDNGTWTETVSPKGISDMSVLSADDMWATCWDGHILHYRGGRWTTYTIYTINGQAVEQGEQPLSISMTSDSDGWAAGLTNATPDGIFLAHFDGHVWTRIHGAATSGPTEINTVAMVSPNEGWAGGDLLTGTSTQAVLLHYQNGQWETAPAPPGGGIGQIVMDSPTEGWAAGGDGSGGLLHYQNGNWTPYHSGA